MAEQNASSGRARTTNSGYEDLFLHHNQKWIAALVAAGLAIFVLLILNVEIDSTIETLILALSPVIAGYSWPPTETRLETRIHRKTENNPLSVDRDVFVALCVALVIYVVAQWFVGDTQETVLAKGLTALIAVTPVVVGALISPK